MRILQDVTHRPLQDAETSAAAQIEARRMLAQFVAAPASFDADHAHSFIVQEWVKESDGVGTAADASDQRIRQASFALQ
ncbi:hypothetical protein OFN94_35925, partial [Escherichia coli]|nr:hypothetical protein [Escherichia coli]